MASSAERDQVVLFVGSSLAAELAVVYLQVLHAAACLASPTVALQYFAVELAIAFCVESEK